MATDDGPEASLSDALERELKAKVLAAAQRRGIVATAVALGGVYAAAIVTTTGRAVRHILAQEDAERAFIEATIKNLLVTLVLATALGMTCKLALPAIMAACQTASAHVGPLIAAALVLNCLPAGLLAGYRVLRFLRTLRQHWRMD